jgi:sarcosine oxidase subunit beta
MTCRKKAKKMDNVTFEIIVIGGGVIGSSIAYHLARQGKSVLVIERARSAVEPAASWASAGGVRRQGRHQAEAKLASEAIARWPTLEQELDANMGYRQGGNLMLAESDSEAEYLATFVQHQQDLGFRDVQLLNRQEALEIVPGLNDRVIAGSYSAADGQADPVLTTRAFATAAERSGATYWNHTEVSTLICSNGRVRGVQTSQGTLEAQHIVLAAGTWSDEITASIGLRLPIRTHALQMLLSTPAPTNLCRPVLSAVNRHLSLKQLNDGAFMLGGGWPGQPTADRRSYTLRRESIEGNWNTAVELLPAVGQQRIARKWCGLEAKSIDDIPFVGAAPNFTGLTLALGFSGHGFAISPAIGRAVADQINGHVTPELDGLSPSRIASFPPGQIESFITERAGASELE